MVTSMQYARYDNLVSYKYPTDREFYSLQGAGNKWGKVAQAIGGLWSTPVNPSA